MATSSFWNRIGAVMGVFVLFAGVMHFASPGFFNDIVPPWLPPSESFWTYASGAAEVVIGVMLLRPSTRRRGAIAAAWLYVLVYPANLYMTWDWRDRTVPEQIVSWVRLPFQFLFIWVAIRVASATDNRPAFPGEPA